MFSNVVNMMCFDLLVNYEWLLNFSFVQQPILDIHTHACTHTHTRTYVWEVVSSGSVYGSLQYCCDHHKESFRFYKMQEIS
jgi:hypothetical protein